MSRSNFKEFSQNEKSDLKDKLKKDFQFQKHIWENPIKFQIVIAGAIHGLDISLKAITVLTSHFEEAKTYFLSQNMLEKGVFSAVEMSNRIEQDILPIEYSYLWSSENLAIIGDSSEWAILFNAELSLGILVFRKSDMNNRLREVIDKFKENENLLPLSEALKLIEYDAELYGKDANVIEKLFTQFS
jgi:hypothetical protein